MLSWRFSLCGRAHLPRRSLLILFGAFLTTGCGGPTSPQTLGPILVCPANLTVQSLDGNASPVIYEPPSVISGEPPIRTPTCVPASGSIFLLGTSIVTCTATDAVLRVGSCAFTVTLTVPPRLAATQFMAFGNSITEGKDGNDPSGHILQNNYPEDLRGMLAGRYTSQTIVMVNRGCGGETTQAEDTICGGGVARLPGALDSDHPQVVLIEEGVNDLGNDDPNEILPMVDALRTMIRQARTRGVQVFLATLLPERAGGSKAFAVSVIPGANDQIRQLATNEGAVLVDLYQGFGGNADPYIGNDGLHPTEQGYQKIAQLFFDAIQMSLELRPGVASSMEVVVRNMPSQNPPFTRFR